MSELVDFSKHSTRSVENEFGWRSSALRKLGLTEFVATWQFRSATDRRDEFNRGLRVPEGGLVLILAIIVRARREDSFKSFSYIVHALPGISIGNSFKSFTIGF